MAYDNGMTPADIAAVTNNNGNGNGWGWGQEWIWIIVLFLFAGGWGGNWGNNGGGATPYATSAVTQADLQRGFDTQSILTGISNIQNGICSLGYDQLAQMNGINTNIMQTGFGIQQSLSNMAMQNANCCCETQRLMERGFADTNYNMATQACEIKHAISDNARTIVENNNSNTKAILDFIVNDKLTALQAENAALKQNAFITANQDAQTAEIIRRLGRDCPQPAYWVQPPTPVPVPVNCNPCGC